LTDGLTVRQASRYVAACQNMNFTRLVATIRLFIVIATQYFALSDFYF